MFFRRIVCLITLLCCAYLVTNAQGTSNKGTDFWVAYAGHIDGTDSRLTLFITSQQNAIVNINAGGTSLPVVNVTANQAVPVVIDPTVLTNTYVGSSDVIEGNKGIHVTSNVPVVVYSHISHSARSAATLVLPTKALGNEYYAMAYNQTGGASSTTNFSQITIVGVEDGTTVEITPTQAEKSNLHAANVTFTKVLNKGDIYQYQARTDITGTKVKTIGTCKPVAVFSGSSQTGFCEPGNSTGAATGSDNLYQQLFPLTAWGKNFITAPFYNATKGVKDIFRIIVGEDGTNITINGSSVSTGSGSLSNPYSKGSIITFTTSSPNSIIADKPISVAQLQVSQMCNPNNAGFSQNNSPYLGDPEMTILNPVEQTLKDITVYSAISLPSPNNTNIVKHYINIILKTSDISTLKLDGSTPNGTFVAINSQYSYIISDVTSSSSSNPIHRITCNNGFSAIAYGYGGYESYAYLAGADLKNLNANVQIYKPGSAVAVDKLCSGESYDIDLQLPYQTAKIVWELKKGSTVIKTETLNPAAPDRTSTVNGTTSYFYNYNNILATDIAAPGVYDLKATVTNPVPTSCSPDEEISSSFEVYALPTAKFTSEAAVCLGNNVNFTDSSDPQGATIVKWYWDYGDGQAETRTSSAAFQHTYAAAGDYTVKLIVETDLGCTSTPFQSVVHIYKLPVADFGSNSPQCISNQIVFTDKSTSAEGAVSQWFWDFGDGTPVSNLQNPSYTYATPGIKTIKLYVLSANGCKSIEISKQIEVFPLPVASFSAPAEACQSTDVQFTDVSTSAAGLTKWMWDFGDNTPVGTTQNPKHNYGTAGSFTVKLTVTNSNNCESLVYSKQITINPLPVSQFTSAATICKNTSMAFTDQSTSAFQITSWLWDFGDNTTSTQQNPLHTYSTAGVKTVVLTVTDAKGCSISSISKQVTVYELPVAKFALSAPTCVGRDILFTDQSTSTDGNITSWKWDFGDGSQLSTQQNPQHSFAAAGNYTVTLYVTSDKACTSVAGSKTITINPLAVADFTMPEICLRDAAATFTNTSIASNAATMTYRWNFGDPGSGAQNTSTAKNPTHIYSTAKDYQVTLTVTPANDNCDVTVVKTFTVNGSTPVAAFNVLNETTLCSDQAVKFVDKATVDFGQITKIEWYFDVDNHLNDPAYKLVDDAPALRSDPSKIYSFNYPAFNTPFQKIVRVRMITYSGTQCFSSVDKIITLRAVPKVDFVLPSDCLTSGTATFVNTTTIGDAPSNLTYLWNFGDASSSSNTSASKDGVHTFSKAKTYNVTLTATSQDGCPVTVTKSFTVSGTFPQASFEVINETSLCSKNLVTFRDLTTVDFGQLSKIEWDFDLANHPNDPTYQIIDNAPASRSASAKAYQFQYPVFYSPATKTYDVRIRAYSGTSCVNEIVKTITLKAVPEVIFNPIPDVCIDAGKIQLSQAEEIHHFLPGNGSYSGNGVTAQGVFDPQLVGVGTYTITYTYNADNGCSDTKTQSITVNPLPTVTTGPDVVVLEGGQVTLPATASGSNLTYQWVPSKYLDHDDVLNPVSRPLDDITYTLLVTSDKGCSAQSKIFVKLLKAPEVPNTFTPNGDGINDTWYIKYLESYPSAVIDVFNRYGEKVYSATNYTLSWDGKKNGADLPAGTYYYIINPKNGRKIISGSVTLIR